jgi:hypothetical protein
MITQGREFLHEHKAFMTNYVPVAITKVQPGDVIRFVYEGKQKVAMVMNPKWADKLHAISLNAISRNDFKKVISDIQFMDEQSVYERDIRQNKNHPYRTYFLNKIKHVQRVDYKG